MKLKYKKLIFGFLFFSFEISYWNFDKSWHPIWESKRNSRMLHRYRLLKIIYTTNWRSLWALCHFAANVELPYHPLEANLRGLACARVQNPVKCLCGYIPWWLSLQYQSQQQPPPPQPPQPQAPPPPQQPPMPQSIKPEPVTPKNVSNQAGMEIDSENAVDGSGDTTKVKSWQLKKKMPGCEYWNLNLII